MRVQAISPTALELAWPALSQGIDRVLKLSPVNQTAEQVRHKVESGEWMMFAVFDEGEPVVTLCAVIREGATRIFEVGLCWGSRVDEWITGIYQMFEVVARECGCSKMAFNGRAGWSKLAKQHGFTVNSVIYIREL